MSELVQNVECTTFACSQWLNVDCTTCIMVMTLPIVGTRSEVKWISEQIGHHFIVKDRGTLGPRHWDKKVMTILHRVFEMGSPQCRRESSTKRTHDIEKFSHSNLGWQMAKRDQ